LATDGRIAANLGKITTELGASAKLCAHRGWGGQKVAINTGGGRFGKRRTRNVRSFGCTDHEKARGTSIFRMAKAGEKQSKENMNGREGEEKRGGTKGAP